jgi:hypothetical protein
MSGAGVTSHGPPVEFPDKPPWRAREDACSMILKGEPLAHRSAPGAYQRPSMASFRGGSARRVHGLGRCLWQHPRPDCSRALAIAVKPGGPAHQGTNASASRLAVRLCGDPLAILHDCPSCSARGSETNVARDVVGIWVSSCRPHGVTGRNHKGPPGARGVPLQPSS